MSRAALKTVAPEAIEVRRPRRLLRLAEACNPDWPSLPVVAYKYARALADHLETVVVTQVRNRPNLERAGFGRTQVIYLDTELIAAPIFKLAMALRGGDVTGWTIQTAMNYPSYLAFEWAAWRKLRGELESGRFDLVHRISPMSPALPSLMARLSPVPFIIGPLNGNLPSPADFGSELRREGEWLSHIRSAYKLLPFHRSTYRDVSSRARSIRAYRSRSAARARTINFQRWASIRRCFLILRVRCASSRRCSTWDVWCRTSFPRSWCTPLPKAQSGGDIASSSSARGRSGLAWKP